MKGNKFLFNVQKKENVPKKISRKIDENERGEKFKKFFVEKIGDKQYKDILPINEGNKSSKILPSNENYTIELIDEEENPLKDEKDIFTLINENSTKNNYPLYSNNIDIEKNISKYI